jgi:hypothetical protein
MLIEYYQRASTNRPRLRVGLLVDSLSLPQWAAMILEQIRGSQIADVVLVVLNQEAAVPPAPAPVTRRVIRLLRGQGRWSFRQYAKRDASSVSADINPETQQDCSELLQDVPRMAVMPLRRGLVHRFPADAVAELRRLGLDVLLHFGFRTLRGDILQAAKHGIWSFHHGDNEFYRGDPACFWELVEGSPRTGVTLEVLTEEPDAGRVLRKGLFQTEPGLSMMRNRVRPYWGAAHFVIESLQFLHRYGWEGVQQRMLPTPPYRGKRSLYRTPNDAEMVQWLAPNLVRRLVGRIIVAPTLPHWRLAIRARCQRTVRPSGRVADTSGFRLIESPLDRSWADPFLLRRDGQCWLFHEEFNYAKNKGNIACRPVSDNGEVGEPIPCLDRGYHLSYPFVFMHDGEVFMIPESVENGTVELYRAVSFPRTWVLEKVLYRARAVDTTLWVEKGIFWFFTSIGPERGDGRLLYLFHSEELTGDWHYHPANPVSSDVRTSRGAGSIFRDDGILYRPSQDCSRTYGYSLGFNRIDELTPERYLETKVSEIEPSWSPGLIGTHTYNYEGNLEVLDCKIASPRSRHYR